MLDRIIFGLLTILVLSCCGSDNQTTENKTFSFHPKTYMINDLVGAWTIYSTVLRTAGIESESTCNVCPTIKFDYNNTAVLTFPTNRTENYSWSIALDTLSLFGASTPTNSTLPLFSNFKYKMEYRHETEFLELKLSPNKDLTYILRR
jgi:hypothetical protein